MPVRIPLCVMMIPYEIIHLDNHQMLSRFADCEPQMTSWDRTPWWWPSGNFVHEFSKLFGPPASRSGKQRVAQRPD